MKDRKVQIPKWAYKEGDPRLMQRVSKSIWYHVKREIERRWDEEAKERDRILNAEEIAQIVEEAVYRDAVEEITNLDQAVGEADNYVADFIKKVPMDDILWKVLVVIGPERFYLLVKLLEGQTIHLPARSKLCRAAAEKEVVQLKNSEMKNLDLAKELKKAYQIEIAAETVGRWRKQEPESDEEHVEELNKLLRFVIIKHRLLHLVE